MAEDSKPAAERKQDEPRPERIEDAKLDEVAGGKMPLNPRGGGR